MKNLKRLIFVIINVIIILLSVEVKAETIKNMTLEQAQGLINTLVEKFEEEGITKGNISSAIEQYRNISKEYSNKEISEMLEQTKKDINNENINEHIDTVKKVLNTIDEKRLNSILEKVNIDDTINELEEGATILELIEKTANNMTVADKADLLISIIGATEIIRKIIIALIILFIYNLLITCIIYKKANKRAWAAIIPIYRDVVMLKICGMSPLWLLLLLIPVIGWLILWIVKVASRFMLAEAFGKGEFFGLVLWLLWPIFGGVLAFSRNNKYIGIE